jgi:predicted nucleic acid-binding protein
MPRESVKIEGNKTYILDTSAILTLWNEERGCQTVEDILRIGLKKKNAFASFMTYMEATYCIWKKQGKDIAQEFYRALVTLPIIKIDANEEILKIATEIKATKRLSVADSWIIATAKQTGSILVHKDPEFEHAREMVELLTLPYKHRTKR